MASYYNRNVNKCFEWIVLIFGKYKTISEILH